MKYEVCLNGVQVLGGEVGSSDFFDTESEAVAFARSLIDNIRRGRVVGDWLSASVCVYESGRVVLCEDA